MNYPSLNGLLEKLSFSDRTIWNETFEMPKKGNNLAQIRVFSEL